MLKEYHYDHLIRWPRGERATVFLTFGHLEKFLSPSRHESDSVTVRGHGRMERAGHGAEGLFRC